MTINFTKFETELLDMLLAGEDPVLSLLQKQLQSATIHTRKQTAAGFYLLLNIPEELQRVTDLTPSIKTDFCFGDVDANISELHNGAGFLIWVKNGYLNQLEGYTYGEPWPAELTNYVLRYRDGQRNIAMLRKEWLIKQS